MYLFKLYTLRNKGSKAVTGAEPFQKVHLVPKVYTYLNLIGTKVYLLKRYRPSDSFWTFMSESIGSIWTEFCHETLDAAVR